MYDASGKRVGAHTARFESHDAGLVDAPGVTGFSICGPALQSYRGDFATPSAIIYRAGDPGFSVATIERKSGHPSVRLSIFGPGGALTASAQVGRYNLGTAPLSWTFEANDPERALFDSCSAPLAIATADGGTVIVPYLINAPFWGPAVVAFDLESGVERWRTRLPPIESGSAPWPPLLASTAGGSVELMAPTGEQIERIDVGSGARLEPLRMPGAPIALGDPTGVGRDQLAWSPGIDCCCAAGRRRRPGCAAGSGRAAICGDRVASVPTARRSGRSAESYWAVIGSPVLLSTPSATTSLTVPPRSSSKSTRRLRAIASMLPPSSSGFSSPNDTTLSRPLSTPSRDMKSVTTRARRSPSAMLYSEVPRSSACPITRMTTSGCLRGSSTPR